MKPFDWRSNNCAHFVGGWIGKCRGIDHATIDARATHDWLMRYCGVQPFIILADTAAHDFGLERIDPGAVQLGDIAMIAASVGSFRALGIAQPPFVVTLGAHGGIVFQRAEPIAVWRP